MKEIYLSRSQYEDLINEKLYINIYDGSLITLCELNRYWKEFAYDLMCELYKADYQEIVSQWYKNLQEFNIELLTFIKNNYKLIIKDYKLNIDFRDYIEINDYITLNNWLNNYGISIEVIEKENHYLLILDN